MCFSATADLVAGVGITLIGVQALRHVRRPEERLLAAIPVILGAHQLVEAFVWWGLEGRISESIWRPALWVYLTIAFGVLPIVVPIAVGALEPVSNRSRVQAFTSLGIAVAIVLMLAVVRGPVEATIEGHHIAYDVDLWHGGTIVALYVVATCGSMLVSKHAHVRWFGFVNLIAVALLAWLTRTGFISLWCGWAAATSVAIALHIRHADRGPLRQLVSTP